MRRKARWIISMGKIAITKIDKTMIYQFTGVSGGEKYDYRTRLLARIMPYPTC